MEIFNIEMDELALINTYKEDTAQYMLVDFD